LTPVGKKLYNSAIKILAEVDRTDEEIKRMINGESGVIRVSTECYTSYHWLPAVLKKFNSEFPNVKIEIVFEATDHPVENLISGNLDIAITSDLEHTDQVEFIKLFSDEMLAVVNNQHPWVEAVPILVPFKSRLMKGAGPPFLNFVVPLMAPLCADSNKP